MSVELYSASGPGANDASLQGTTVGGSKPLHRFIKGQPKIVGVIVLALGVSFFVLAISLNASTRFHEISSAISPGFLMGTLFLMSGILFILTEHNPTKKTVTVSLALSIVTILGAFWSVLHLIYDFHGPNLYRHYDYSEDNTTDDDTDWSSYAENMGFCLEMLFLFYILVGIVIFIVMSCLAGAALRSTKSQTVVVMTATPTETPVE